MPRRHFTVVEVNRLIPALERIFIDVVQLHGGLRRAEAELESLGVTPSRAILTGEDDGGSPGIRRGKAKFRAHYESLLEALGRVSELGGEVKDPEIGLVDFPGQRGGEDIYLCWKLGEKRIGHWHPVGTGYADRRPIDHLVPRDRSPLD